MEKKIFFWSIFLVASCIIRAQVQNITTENLNISYNQNLIYNGIPWFDNNGNIVNAHGACIVQDNGKYYLFGEYKSDESNAFSGFSCYSSEDLVNWKFERVVLPMQADGKLGPNRVGERVKVMRCPSTGEYVMFMHADNLGYNDPYICYATCNSIAGEYTYQGSLQFNGQPIKRWDMGTFQDPDGNGYLLIHGGIIYRLSKDFHTAERKVLDGVDGPHGESPAMFKKNGIYFFLFSNLTSWEKNDNFYYTSGSLSGPWTKQGLFCPEGSLTYNSQTTFVFPLIRNNDTIPMFMGDRWSFPHQASAASYVWLPLQVNGLKLSIPEYWTCWNPAKIRKADSLRRGKVIPIRKLIFEKQANWRISGKEMASNVKGSKMSIPFIGTQIAITGKTNCHGGYARVTLLNKNGKTITTSLVDFYSKVPNQSIRYKTPLLVYDKYQLTIEVTGESPVWSDKTKAHFGSDDCYVIIHEVILNNQ